MREGLIERTVVPRNPLDVLAQQIVAIAASARGRRSPSTSCTRWSLRTYSFGELSRAQLENVLDMLDGRYPSEEFGELRPRIVWDRVAGTIRARKGARALAITNAGTIPDRGLFSVNLPDGRRVGELDEEMVYEARPGQVFLLGASSWRIEDITRDRVVVTPAPGVPGAVPFWKGDGVGRPRELGEAIGAFSRWAVEQDADDARATTTTSTRSPRRTCSRSCASSRRPRASCRRDRAIVVERFRDEIGDWRLCVLSPVRRPRARRLGARAERPDPRPVRPRVRRDLVRRRDHRPPARRRRAAGRRARADRPRRARGPRGRRARRLARCSARASARTPAARC